MSCRLISLVVILLIWLEEPAVAKPIRLNKHGFMIEMPEGWKIAHRDDPADPGKLSASNPENAANITVMLVPISAKESAANVLAMMDGKRQSVNELRPEDAKITKPELKKIGARDGIRGQYKEAEIVQHILVVTDKKQAYLVIGAMRQGQEGALSETINAAMASFRILR